MPSRHVTETTPSRQRALKSACSALMRPSRASITSGVVDDRRAHHRGLTRDQLDLGFVRRGPQRKAGLGVQFDRYVGRQHHLALLALSGAVIGREFLDRRPHIERRPYHHSIRRRRQSRHPARCGASRTVTAAAATPRRHPSRPVPRQAPCAATPALRNSRAALLNASSCVRALRAPALQCVDIGTRRRTGLQPNDPVESASSSNGSGPDVRGGSVTTDCSSPSSPNPNLPIAPSP